MMVPKSLAVLALFCLASAFGDDGDAPNILPQLTNHPSGLRHSVKRSSSTRGSAKKGVMFPPDDDEVVRITGKFWYVSDYTYIDSVQDVVDEYIAKMNEVAGNSDVKVEYEQWGTIQNLGKTSDEVTYNEDDPNRNFADAFVDSGLFEDDEAAHAYIKQTADQMILLTNKITGGYAGKCLGFGPWEDGWDGIYYTVVIVGDPDYGLTFAHEAGHCLGGMHNEEAPWGTGSTDNANFGHCLGDYATVMSYETTCPDGPATTIPYFSNPDVEYCDDAGVCAPTGTEEHNNVAYINENRWTSRDYGTNCNDGVPDDDDNSMPNSCAWTDWGEWSDWSDCCCDDYDTWDADLAADQCTVWIYHYSTFDYFYHTGTNRMWKLKVKECQNGDGEEVYPYYCGGDGNDLFDYDYETCSCAEEIEEGTVVGESAECIELIAPDASFSMEAVYYLQDDWINGHYSWATADGGKTIYWYIGSSAIDGAWYVAYSGWVNAEDTSSQFTAGYGELEDAENPWDDDWDFWYTDMYVQKLDSC